MMSALVPRSRRAQSWSTVMKRTGYSGGAAGAALASITPATIATIKLRRTRSPPDDPCPRPHRGPAVAEALGLHRLSLAAVRDRIDTEVGADGVDVDEIVARVGGDAAVA